MPDSMTPQTPTEALATALQTVLRQNIGTNAPLRDFERRASDLLAALTAAGYSLRPTEEDIDDPQFNADLDEAVRRYRIEENRKHAAQVIDEWASTARSLVEVQTRLAALPQSQEPR